MPITVSDPLRQPVAPPRGLVLPPPAVVRAVRDLLAREGLAGTRALLGLGRDACTRLRAGLPVHRATLAVARAALAPIAPDVQP